MNQPVQEHFSPISMLSFYRLIIHLPPDSRILLLLSLIALMGNVQGCFWCFPCSLFSQLVITQMILVDCLKLPLKGVGQKT